MAAGLKNQNLAILVTDIAGFTATTARQTREENAAWLQLHASLVTPIFTAFGGVIRQEMGDAFLCTFPSPTDAVLCGMAVLDRLWEHNQGAPAGQHFNVRVVVNMGEVQVHRDGHVQGEPVNLAARVEEVAEGGDVTLTEGVFLAMNRSEVELESLGSHALKGMADSLVLHRVKKTADPRTHPFGGAQLERARQALASSPIHSGEARARAWARETSQAPAGQGPHPAMLKGAVVLLLLGSLLGGLGWGAYRWVRSERDPYHRLEEKLEVHDVEGASAAWDLLEETRPEPAWKLDYYLGRISALEGVCGDLLVAYRDALEKHPPLASDEHLATDVVACLDRKPERAEELIRSRLGKHAVEALRRAVLEPTLSADTRLQAMALLEDLGVRLGRDGDDALLQIVEGGDRCKKRREAIRRLSERGATHALPRLRKELEVIQESEKRADQSECLVGMLKETIRTLDGK